MVGRHCPFLNREDERCANHFRVSRLQHAFSHCVGDYDACPTYREMLAERRLREQTMTPLMIGGRVVTQDESHRISGGLGGVGHANTGAGQLAAH